MSNALADRVKSVLSGEQEFTLSDISMRTCVSSSVVFRELQAMHQRREIFYEEKVGKLLWRMRRAGDPEKPILQPHQVAGAKQESPAKDKRKRRTGAEIAADNEALRLQRERNLPASMRPPVYPDVRMPDPPVQFKPVTPNPGESMFDAACRLYGGVSKEATKYDNPEGRIRTPVSLPAVSAADEAEFDANQRRLAATDKSGHDQVSRKVSAGKKSMDRINVTLPQLEVSVDGDPDLMAVIIRVKLPQDLSAEYVDIPVALIDNLCDALKTMRDQLLAS